MKELERRAAPRVLVTSPDPWELAALVQHERARKAMVVIEEQRLVADGVWGVLVYQVKPMRKRWVRPAAVTAGVAAAGALFWWLVSALLAILPLVLGALILLAVVTRVVAGGRGTQVDVHVRVRS